MKSIVLLILFVYTVIHVIFRFGGMLWVCYQLYIAKTVNIEDIKGKNSLMNGHGTIIWSLVEHIVMTFVFVWLIVYLW